MNILIYLISVLLANLEEHSRNKKNFVCAETNPQEGQGYHEQETV